MVCLVRQDRLPTSSLGCFSSAPKAQAPVVHLSLVGGGLGFCSAGGPEAWAESGGGAARPVCIYSDHGRLLLPGRSLQAGNRLRNAQNFVSGRDRLRTGKTELLRQCVSSRGQDVLCETRSPPTASSSTGDAQVRVCNKVVSPHIDSAENPVRHRQTFPDTTGLAGLKSSRGPFRPNGGRSPGKALRPSLCGC